MLKVKQQIYQALTQDAQLTSELADFNGNPAVFGKWGRSEVSPYIVITYASSNEEYYAQNSSELQLDIFERRGQSSDSAINLYAIRDHLVRILDGYRSLNGEQNLRVYYNSESEMQDDDGRLRRYMISFEVRHMRFNDV